MDPSIDEDGNIDELYHAQIGSTPAGRKCIVKRRIVIVRFPD